MKIGDKISKLRKESNLTQEQFAEMLEVSRQSVSKWELNEMYPETDKLIIISKIFNCSLDYLLKDEIEETSVNTLNCDSIINIKKIGAYSYLSFAPIIGMYFGFKAIAIANKSANSDKLIPTIGTLVSFVLTILMIVGVLFDL